MSLVLLALLGACAGARRDQPVVRDLELEGVRQLSAGDIKARIVTGETPWWQRFWPFAEPEYFDPNAWAADLRRIERFYQAQGYYQARVVDSEVRRPGERDVRLRVRVTEGEPTHIAQVQVLGLEQLPADERARALDELPLVEGAVFREEDWAGVKETVRGRLRELGYAEAEVGGEVAVDVETREARVLLSTRPGQRYRFGNVFVATDANPKVSVKRIIEQAQGAVEKGEWYNETALAEAQARVFKMGVFGGVKVNRGAPDREAGTVPVVVDVREAPFHSLRAGGGVGVDQRRQEARVLAEYTDRNFGGGLRRLTTRARAGWAFIPSTLSVVRNRVQDNPRNGPVFDLLGEFEQPRLLFRDLRLQASLELEKGLEEAYGFYGGRARAGVVWQPHPAFSVFPSYNLELYWLSLYQRGGDPLLGGRTPQLVYGCRDADLVDPETGKARACRQALSYLDVTAEWDRRNDRNEPRRGYYASLSLQAGGGVLQGDFDYLRLLPEARFYQSFLKNDRLTLATRVRLGSLVPFRGPGSAPGEYPTSPIVNRFYAGGANSMRGFNARRLSPHVALTPAPPDPEDPNPLPPVLEPEATVPVGGNSLFESTVEARYQVSGPFVVAAFWDTGLVGVRDFRSWGREVGVGDLYHAVGVGLRYLTVVGPIRLDLARRLPFGPPLTVSNGEAYTGGRPGANCFGLGEGSGTFSGAPDSLCSFHISIGEAF